MEKYLEAGIIVNTHGVRGDVKIMSLCDNPKVLSSIKTLFVKENNVYTPLNKTKSSVVTGKDLLIVHFEGMDTFEDAVKYKGCSVYADREDIPLSDGDFFIADVIGLPVIDARDGRVYGTVTDVFNQGAQDLFEVKKNDGSTALIPSVPDFISLVDVEKGVFVTPIEGLL